MIRLLPLLLVVLLTGCYATFKAYHKVVVDPDNTPSFDKSYLVTYSDNKEINSDNVMIAKYFVPRVAEALKKKGFQNIYVYNEEGREKYDGIFYVMLSTHSSIIEYDSPVYGTVNSGVSNINCTEIGTVISCDSRQKTAPALIGYKTTKEAVKNHVFTLMLATLDANQSNLYSPFRLQGAMEGTVCSSLKYYEMIIDETISRADFSVPVESEFTISKPLEFKQQCR